ncbi:MAG: hypothetical protein IJH05_00595 [Firmicutes bacterium]|nr:hypothetical protein [Bacillota bacterium]
MTDKCVLGIDTSNYKTSLAIVCGRDIAADIRRFLTVKEGERGLRQSEALFQHVQNLPELFAELRESFHGTIDAVAYSTRPRPMEGSYMPCFTAGRSQAIALASALDVPAIGFSHQEGHIEAAVASCGRHPQGDYIGCHFSGGTCEVLRVSQNDYAPTGASAFTELNGENSFYDIEIIGGTRDISYGQVLDRAGVQLGIPFPCGQALDEIALRASDSTNQLTGINVREGYLNLSGFDTQLRNKLSDIAETDRASDALIKEAFIRISDSIIKMLVQCTEKTGIRSVYLSGGVASSRYIRDSITEKLQKEGCHVHFAAPELSSDNAVGTALLGSRYLWD